MPNVPQGPPTEGATTLTRDNEERVVAAMELVALSDELEATARMAQVRAAAARAGAKALLAEGGDHGQAGR